MRIPATCDAYRLRRFLCTWCAAFCTMVGRHLARLLEIGTRSASGETGYYPGYDMVYRRDPETGVRFETRDGTLLAPDDEPARLKDDPENLKPASPLDIE